MSTAYELNLEYGLVGPDEDELESIGTEEERSEALIGASLPSITPPSLDTESFLAPPEETTPIVPTGLARQPSIPRAEAKIKPIAQPTQARGPIYRTAEAMLSPAEKLNREYGLTPITEGIVPREISRPESPATRLNREMGLSPLTRPIGETSDTQEPGTPVSTIFKDLMVPVEPVPPPPPEKPGLIGEVLRGIPHGVLQVGEIAGGLVGLAGEVTGIEAIERVGSSLHKTFQEMNEKFKPTVAGFQDIESVGDAVRYLGHGFMSMLPFMVGTFGVGAAIRGVVTKTLGKAITERAAAKAIIGFSSLAAASTIAETGIIAGERINEGMKALSLNLLWAAPAGLMDALPGWRLMGKLGWFGRAVTERAERAGLPVARRYFLKEVGRQGFFEGITESAQEIMEEMGTGRRPFTYESLMQAANAFIIAGFTGGVLGGAVSLLGPSPRKKVAPPPAVAPPVAPLDITRDPTDLLKPAVVAKPDIAALWQETVLPTVAEEPVPMDEVSRIWRNFLGGTKAWTDIDVQPNKQVVIKDSRGGQLSFDFNSKQPAGKEFTPRTYTDKNGISTVLSPNVPLPQSLKDTIAPEAKVGGVVLTIPTPVKGKEVTIFKNPTDEQFKNLTDSFKEKYPNAPIGEPKTRFSYDREGNVYRWQAGEATHDMVEDQLKSKYDIEAKQSPDMLPKPEAKVEGKQPWEMTREEFSTYEYPPLRGGENLPEAQRVSKMLSDTGIPVETIEVRGSRALGVETPRSDLDIYVKVAEKDANSADSIVSLLSREGIDVSVNQKMVGKVGGILRGDKTHERIIQQALLEGKPVPSEVMKDYPELAKEARVEGVKKPRKIGVTSYSGRFVTAGYGTTRYSGTERITRKNYNAAYEQGDLPDVWYAYGDEHEVEPMFRGMPPQRVEAEFKIFDMKLATKEELAEFNAKQDEVAARLERKWGFNRNMPDQAQVLGYQAAKELGYDGLNTGRAIAMFHDLPVQMRPKEGVTRGAGVTAAPTPPGAGLVPAATLFIEGAKIDLLRKEVVEPKPRVEGKQLWEMTRDQYWLSEIKRSWTASEMERPEFVLSETERLLEPHRKEIAQAISEGKPVPPEVMRDYPELARETRGVGIPTAPPGLPKGFFEAVIMFDEQGAVSVRPFSHEGAENLPGFLGKVIIDAKKDTVYTPEMMIARNAGEAINGITRSKIESLSAEGFRPAFQELLPGDRFRARVGGDGSLREWFGNSKVVDANGNPLTLYRGGAEGGKFFTDSLAAAKKYGKQITSVFLRMENPKVIDYKGASDKDLYSLDMPEAKSEGYDGIIAKNVDDGYQVLDQYVVFDSKQVRPTEGIEGAARPVVPPFYHLSEVIINSKMTGPMSSTQILKMLQNAGVKQDELVWTGLDDLLKQPKKFTKQEVLDYLKEYQGVKEKLVPEMDPMRLQYRTPGLINRQNLVLYSKDIEPYTPEDTLHFGQVGGGRAIAWASFGETVDAEGNKVMVVDEVQSKRHQAGREKGYRELPSESKVYKDKDALGNEAWYVEDKTGKQIGAGSTREDAIDNAIPGRVPPAPFSKTWHELSMRRMVRWAAEKGYDKVAWTTGEQQIQRYRDTVIQVVDEISIYRNPDGTYNVIFAKGGTGVREDKSISVSGLKGILGKSAEDIIRQADEANGKLVDIDVGEMEIGGEFFKLLYDVKIPSYMNTFGKKWGVKVEETQIPTEPLYAVREISQIIPGEPEKIYEVYNRNRLYPIKQFPNYQEALKYADIESRKIGGPTVHSLDITPSMKESVLYEGQPLFREAMQGMEGQPMSVMAVQKVLNNFGVHIPADVLGWKVLSSVNEIPADILKRGKVTGKTQAFYDRVLNEIYVIADRHTSDQDVLTSICHELFAHFGFERLFGPHRMDQIVQEVLKFYGKENLSYLYQAYSKIPGSPDGDYTVAIEKIAEFAGTGENPGLWKRFVYWFRYYATQLFGPIRFSEDDIRAYLWRSRILIQQQSFQDKIRKYNAFVKLSGANMWDNGLPIGPPGARFAMREDTSPSHESAAENFTGWKGWYEAYSNKDKNFGNEIFKRLGLVESVASLPHWIGMNHPSFKPTTQVQWDRMDEKNRDRLYLLQDPGTNQGNNPYMSVDLLKDTSGVDPLIVWSDRNDIYLESDENLQRKARELIRRDLTPVEIKAYRGWKDGFDRAVDYAIARLRQLSVDFYSSAKWFDQLRGVLDGTIPMGQVQLEGSDAKDFQRALKKVAERMQTIDEQEANLKKLNFYAPHVRGRGDYIVRVYDIDPEGKDVAIWVERFDSATQAERARMRLGGQYRDLRVVKTLEKQTSEFIYGGLNVYAMEAFLKKSAERAVKEGKINETEADTLLNAVFKSMNDEIMARGFRQHYIRRQQGNIGGYREENLRQVFLDYMSGLAGSMAKLDATRKFHDALQGIDKVNESETYEYASRYATDMLRNRDSLDNKLNALKTIPYLWYISMNLRLAATQMFQNGITAYPILSRIMQDLGVEGHASTELAKAMVDLRGNMTVQEQTMLQNAYNDGETMANFIQEIKGDISRSWAGKYFTKFVDVVSYPFAGMERFNRKSSLLAAFRVALRAGQTETEAYETAKEFVRSAHYAYGLNNFPQLLRDGTPFSKIAGLAYVFRSFPHNYVLSMIHYIKGKDGKLALGVLMRSLAVLTILGGLGAAPFIDDILDELERQTGYPARSVIRKSLEKIGGPLLASAGMEGILALVGLDMSGSTKIQIPIPGVGEYNPGTIMMGVYEGLIDKGKNAISFAANNQWMRAVESAMPAGVESAIRSHRLATEGLRTTTGKPILDIKGKPIKAGPYEVAVGLAGFRPARIAEIQKERRVAQNIKDAYAERRKKIMRKMRLATTPEERRELSKDIQSYNLSVMKYGKIIPKIGVQSIKQAMQPERGYMEYERLFED